MNELEEMAGRAILTLLVFVFLCALLQCCSFPKEIQVKETWVTVTEVKKIERWGTNDEVIIRLTTNDGLINYFEFQNWPTKHFLGEKFKIHTQ